MYKNLDKENMFNAIWEFPDNLSEANKLGQNIKLQQDYQPNLILLTILIGMK